MTALHGTSHVERASRFSVIREGMLCSAIRGMDRYAGRYVSKKVSRYMGGIWIWDMELMVIGWDC